MKLRSYAVVGYNIESHQVNTYPPSHQKYLLSSELLLPSSCSFLANCCKNYFLSEHSDEYSRVCFLWPCLLVGFFFLFSFVFFLSGLSQILAPLAPLFLKCPVVHKKCRAEKNSGQGDKRGLCHKIFVLVHKAQRFEPQRLPDCFKILFIFLFL